MAKTPEAKVKEKVVAKLDSAFAYLSDMGFVRIAPEQFNPTAYEYP